MKKAISLVLCLLMITNIFPLNAFAQEEQNLEEIIRPQIEAFAKSIDKKDANKSAQDALIGHGLRGKGKTLSVGKDHALTATLMNSELMKACLTNALAEMITLSKETGKNEIYELGGCGWHLNDNSYYRYCIYDYKVTKPEIWGDGYWYSLLDSDYSVKNVVKYEDVLSKIPSKKFNEYDETLKIIVGGNHVDLKMKLLEVKNGNEIYHIDVTSLDIFDFDTDNGSALENLFGFVGMFLFNPYKWESKFSFQIEIPIEKPEMNADCGDADGDGVLSARDATRILQHLTDLLGEKEIDLLEADFNGDGKVSSRDVTAILKYLVGA